MWGSKEVVAIWTWRVVGADLKELCETVPSKPGREKSSVLIRLLVLKLPIDFYRGWLWAGDQPEFLASTKAKLSHLDAESASWDQHSPLTRSQFVSIRWSISFFEGRGSCRISTQWSTCWWSWRAIFSFHQSSQFGSRTFCFSLDNCGQVVHSWFIHYFLYKLTCQKS